MKKCDFYYVLLNFAKSRLTNLKKLTGEQRMNNRWLKMIGDEGIFSDQRVLTRMNGST